jgi:hypothetical protein
MGQGRLALHVGAMKTGTTYLQGRLFANKSTLAHRHVLLPGKQWRTQSRAVWGLLNGEGRQWRRMAHRISAHEGLSVVSMEFLAAAPEAKARALRDSVEVDIDVVITARDLNRAIPAMWQESVRNGRTWTYDRYVAAVPASRPGLGDAREASRAGTHFWRQQDLVSIARTWAGVVGPERVTVVTVPPPGAPRDLLWERFTSVVGLDREGLVPGESSYESLGAASAQVMRRFNELFEHNDLTFAQSQVARKVVLAGEVLGRRKPDEPAIGLAVEPWVVEETARVVADLQALGVRLEGSWDDLTPVDVPGIDPGTLDDAEVAEAAIAGLAGFLETVVRDPGVLDR